MDPSYHARGADLGRHLLVRTRYDTPAEAKIFWSGHEFCAIGRMQQMKAQLRKGPDDVLY